MPNKNFRQLCGRPLYLFTLRALLASARVARVVIDTDCPPARLRAALDAALSPADAARVDILERPAHLCGDMVPMNEVLAHDVAAVRAGAQRRAPGSAAGAASPRAATFLRPPRAYRPPRARQTCTCRRTPPTLF